MSLLRFDPFDAAASFAASSRLCLSRSKWMPPKKQPAANIHTSHAWRVNFGRGVS
jgi:hypothetical protein